MRGGSESTEYSLEFDTNTVFSSSIVIRMILSHSFYLIRKFLSAFMYFHNYLVLTAQTV